MSIAGLIKYVNSSVTSYHAVEGASKMLDQAGFERLEKTGKWNVKRGGSYYCVPFATCLIAFRVGENDGRIRIGAGHTDHPGLHLKAHAEKTDGGYLRLNTEVYGGPILSTWMDRPLSMAGRVALQSGDELKPEMRLIDIKRPVITIPNLAIHYNKEVNKGVELKKQNDMLPIIGLSNADADCSDTSGNNTKDYLVRLIASELGCEEDDILDFDMHVYNPEKGTLVGAEGEMLSSPRLDNLTSCFALTRGIINAKAESGINCIALFDNEECGSGTKQGADSALLRDQLVKLYSGLDLDETRLADDLSEGLLLSCDVAHAYHPAHGEKYDSSNSAPLNSGVVIKLSANQRYSFDSEAVAVLAGICRKHSIRYTKFVNHSDAVGGSTLGPMLSKWLPTPTVDIGVPLLAMHSARELMGIEDQKALEDLIYHVFL